MSKHIAAKLSRDSVQDIVELVPMQEGLLFHHLKEPESRHYHVQLALELTGHIDYQAFQKAWECVVQSNEALRTVFRWYGLKRPVQIVLKTHDVNIKYIDFSSLAQYEQQSLIEETKLADQSRAFDLLEIPLRITLYKLATERFILLLSNHHILYDGWSNGIILRELFSHYRQLQNNEPLHIIVKTPFKAYVKWLQKQDKQKQKKFWQEYLKDFDTQMRLPVENRQTSSTRTAACYTAVCPTDIWQQLTTFCRSNQVTMAAVLYSAVGIVLQKYHNSDDVVFGTTVSGRTGDVPDILNTVGLFIQTVPLRVHRVKRQTIIASIQQMNADLHTRMEFENTPLVDIKSYSGLETEREIFETNVVVESYPLDQQLLTRRDSIAVTGFSANEMAGYSLTIVITLLFNSLEIAFKYTKEYFAAEAIVGLSDCLLHILATMVNNPSCRLEDVEIIPPAVKKQLLRQCNATTAEYPAQKTLQILFAEQVEKYPERVAVYSYQESLSYVQLYDRSGCLAAHLREYGVGAETVVGICAERSISLLVGILAILQAGGAYLPLDPQLPVERLRYMLQDSRAKIVLCQARFAALPTSECVVLKLEDAHLYTRESETDIVAGHSHNLAYIIYTSGSTGQPKGVPVEHRSVVNRLYWEQRRYPLGEHDVVLQKTSIMFDFSVWELFSWFSGGAALCLLNPGDEADPRAICETIAASQVTTIHFVPSMFQAFLDYLQLHDMRAHLASLRRVSTGGEILRPSQIAQFYTLLPSTVQLINMYGPTETTIDVSYHECSAWDAQRESVPIGKPIDNTRLYVLNKDRTLQPAGVPGELYIAGAGVSRGYLNNAELTAGQFVQDPFYPTERMYASGDFARWLPGGELEYLGRVDHQVKIRGFRIELGEVEAHLLLLPMIKEAVAMVIKDASGDDRLCAYVVPGENLNTRKAKDYLATKLPHFMIPDTFVGLERFPLTIAGKVDRNKLAQIAPDAQQSEAFTETQLSSIERTIAEIWAETLGVDRVGLDDVFFDIGGNSLKVLRVCGRLMKTLQTDLPVTALFRFPTVRLLARHIVEEVIAPPPAESIEEATDEQTADGQSSHEVQSVITPEPEELAQAVRDQDVAVIGMAGRFPGASNTDEFWNNLKHNIESIKTLTDEELLSSGVTPEVFNHLHYVKAKGVLDGVECFDEQFFGYSPREAMAMDPQMRLLHECIWEAVENAGYNTETYDGIIGLFAGSSPNFHWLQKIVHGPTNQLDDFFLMLLNEKDFLSSRIAHKMNFKGPSVTVQTACTTSLTAIHSAYHELLKGDCDMTVAAGVSVTYPIRGGYFYEEGMIYSPDGHCRAFDERAQGTVSGNGVGVVVLKRLKDALRDGDSIHAVIKGSAISNDGMSKVGFTAPGVDGQVRAISGALAMADVAAESITYVEAHGTATTLGDPIEAEALKLAFQTSKTQFCALGSVKTNIGALGVAGGIAGFIKTVLSLEHAQLPASLHFERPNPNIDLGQSPFYIVKSFSQWKRSKEPLRAGINAFGMGGNNAHVVLEEAPVVARVRQEKQGWQLIPLSAKSEASLQAITTKLHSYLQDHPELSLADVAYTLQVGRKAFARRRYFVCSTNDEVLQALAETQDGGIEEPQPARVSERQDITFLFCGHGSQYVTMGADLYRDQITFKAEVDHCLALVQQLCGIDVHKALYPDHYAVSSSLIDQPEYSYLSLFIFEYALAKLLMSLGIKPVAMIGYDLGEYVAACLSGVFTLVDTLTLVVAHAKCMQQPGSSLKGQIEEFASVLTHVTFNPPSIPFISSTSGTWVCNDEVMQPDYWIKQLHHHERFSEGIEELVTKGTRIFIEVGPGYALTELVRNHIKDNAQVSIINFCRHVHAEKVSDTLYFLRQLGQLWSWGVAVDWITLHSGQKRQRIPLPTYAFEARRFWPDDQQKTMPIQMEQVATDQVSEAQRYLPPNGDIEYELIQIWKYHFGFASVGVHDNFFDLGTTSLGLLQVNALIKDRLNIELPLVILYEHPTIHALARFINGNPISTTSTAEGELNKSKSLLKNAATKLNKKNE